MLRSITNKDNKRVYFFPGSFWDIIRVAFFVVAYFIAFQIAYLFPDAERILVAIWPAGGIGLAALLLSQRRLWFIILAAFFLAGNISNLMIGRPLFNSMGFMIANIIESYGCAWLIVRWCGEDIRFTTLKEISALIFGAVFVNAGTALIGGGTAWIAGISPFWSFWKFWWIADGLGILIIAPLFVTWGTFRDISIRHQWKLGLEGGIFMVIWYEISKLSFHVQASGDPFTANPYILVALLAYASLRLGQRSVTVALFILLMVAITSEAMGTGPSPLGGNTMNDRLLLLQVFMSSIAVTGYIVAASYSESKLAERSSREDQSRIRALGDNIPNGLVYQIVREPYGGMHFLYLSAGIEKLDGISAKEGLRDPSTIYNLFLEEDRPKIAKAEEFSLRNMSTFNVVARLRRPDGQLRWMQLSASPRRLEDGRVLWDGIQMDITERKNAEDALQASLKKREELEFIINNSRVIVFLWRNETGWPVEYVSGNITQFGYTPEEFMNGGIHYANLIHTGDLERVGNEVAMYSEQGVTEFRQQYRIITKSGDVRWTDDVTWIRRDQQGNITHYQGIVMDISQRKLAEEELKKHREHLEEMVKERTAQLNQKNEELEKFNKLFVGRELRMIELKKKIAELEKKVVSYEDKKET